MTPIEWGATILSLVYLYLAIKNKPICFVFGILSSFFWAIAVYRVHLVFDTGLQIFYIIISAVGLYRWKFGGDNKEELPITTLPLRTHIYIIIIGLIISSLLIFSSRYIELINKPFLDAITTVFLVIGTILLVERKLYSWFYLVIADIGYLYIYGSTGLWLFFGMMIVFIVAGIMGYGEWKKMKLP